MTVMEINIKDEDITSHAKKDAKKEEPKKEIYIKHLKGLIANISEIEEELLNLIKIKISIGTDIHKKKKQK